jgi:tetratricopeptide (TPR) repeat protein|tara:strand:- start:84 stop:818 length:735 start_codon:yes stop_codon:yes gene_type:complete
MLEQQNRGHIDKRERLAMKHHTNSAPYSLVCVLLCTLFIIIGGCSQPSNTTLLEQGNYAMWQGRWSDAANAFTKATSQHPGDWEANYNLGKCYLEMGEPQMASQSLAVAESLRPEDTEIADLYAESLLLSGERDLLFTFLLGRAKRVESVRAWMVFAEYTMEIDDPDSATTAINMAIKLSNGSDARPYVIAATFAERLGDDTLAVTRWKEAWIIEPTNEDISNALRAHGIVPGPTMTGVDDAIE